MIQKCEYCNTNIAVHYDGQNHVCQECIDWVEEAFKIKKGEK